MAITATSLQPVSSGWTVNASSADASGCEEIKAAPGADLCLCVRQLEVSCVAAITVTVGAGETAGAVTTVVVGPLNFAATSGSPVSVVFNPAIKLAANTSLTVDASGAGAVQVLAQGYTT